MIDIKFLRENPEVVKENIRKKFQDEKLPLVDEVIGSTQRAEASKRRKRTTCAQTEIRFLKRSAS